MAKIIDWIIWEYPGEREIISEIIENNNRMDAMTILVNKHNCSSMLASKIIDTYNLFIKKK